MNDDYMLVEVNAQGLGRPYPALKKVVPTEYKQRPFKELVDFMIYPEEDVHGNAPLDLDEKELAQELWHMLDRSKKDDNYLVTIDPYRAGTKIETPYEPVDIVGEDTSIFEHKLEHTPAGDPITYDKLEFRVQAFDAGGR